jgi:hypothetical protein
MGSGLNEKNRDRLSDQDAPAFAVMRVEREQQRRLVCVRERAASAPHRLPFPLSAHLLLLYHSQELLCTMLLAS